MRVDQVWRFVWQKALRERWLRFLAMMMRISAGQARSGIAGGGGGVCGRRGCRSFCFFGGAGVRAGGRAGGVGGCGCGSVCGAGRGGGVS